MMFRQPGVLLLFAAAMAIGQPVPATPKPASVLPTPLEAHGNARLPTSSEIDEYLRKLAASDPRATISMIGHSAGGRPVNAFVISAKHSGLGASRSNRLTVLLVAGQHGGEPSGTEASLMIARDLLQGSLQRYLQHLNVVVIPLANPDGRDNNRRGNAAGVNISTNFVVLDQPEARALAKALIQFSPHVVLDVHESSALKEKTLGAQGYLIDFETQFDVGNNPNVAPQVRAFGVKTFLPSLIAGVRKRGQRARHYIGEVTNINQPATHAGLSVRNLRNYAAMRGAVSVLMENRLDPPGRYETPRNIKVRTAKQYLGIDVVLERTIRFRRRIRTAVDRARTGRAIRARRTIAFDWRYEPHPTQPRIRLPLRKRATNERIARGFAYHGRIVRSRVAKLGTAYVVTDHRSVVAELLDRHGIRYDKVASVEPRSVGRKRQGFSVVLAGGATRSMSTDRNIATQIAPGALWVDNVQAGGLLASLLLDPRSSNSLFRYPPYSSLAGPAEKGIVNID